MVSRGGETLPKFCRLLYIFLPSAIYYAMTARDRKGESQPAFSYGERRETPGGCDRRKVSLRS